MSWHVETYDAIVVGGRVAGASAGMLLARRGHRVLVVDRAAKGSDTLSTHALMRGAVVQLDRWGVLERVREAGTPPVREVTFRYGTEEVLVPIRTADGIDALYAPRRTVLDPILADAAEASGADVRFGVTVSELIRDERGRVGGIRGQGPDGEPFEARARLTVGADGSRSLVARLVNAPVTTPGTATAAVVYGHFGGVEGAGYEFLYTPGLTAGLMPTNEGTVAFVAMPPERFREEVRTDVVGSFGRLLSEIAPDTARRVEAGAPPERFRTFPGLVGFLRRPWGPGWALVGDAGYFKDPITAHGITDALRDAELLAIASDGMFSGMPESIALGGYERTRDELSHRLFTATDAVASFRWDLADVKSLLLEASAAMQAETEFLVQLHERMAAA